MFLTKDFLLKGETAKKFYHDFAADMPIIDYQIWLGGLMIQKQVWKHR